MTATTTGSGSTCPACGAGFDPLRTRAVRVVGGKVVAFCSTACARADVGADEGPAVRASAVPKPAVLDPAVRDPAVRGSAVRGSAVRGPAVAKPAVRGSAVAKPAVRGSAVRDSAVRDPAVPKSAVPKSAVQDPAVQDPAVRGTDGDDAPVTITGAPDGSVAVDGRRIERQIARPRRRLTIGVGVAVIVVGGMAIALIQAVSPSSPAGVVAAPSGAERVAVAPPVPVVVPPPPPTAADARALAEATLHELIESPSRRIALAAALALSRSCEPAAREHLRGALSSEPSAIARLGAAYALARCDEPAGRAHLMEALHSSRRDVKAEAARHLVTLGDDAGLSFLHRLLDRRQYRLGAAEVLAVRADPEAVDVLKSVHRDRKTSADDRMRAAIALGWAGDAEVRDELRGALDDPRFRPAAAAALARLGDADARAALVAGLEVPSLRVDAARALRRLEPELDAALLVGPLLAAVAAERDTSEVSAAEALLVLTGPATDAELP